MDSPTPPFAGDPSSLLLIDWSWWLNKAFRLGEIEGMTSYIVGWLCRDVLAHGPAHVALALDSTGPTFRHRMRHPTDPMWRYKGKRDPKPEAFFAMAAKCTALAELHSIPTFWAEGWEADDVIATVTRRARAAGYRVWICSADKDLEGLAEESEDYGTVVGLWHNAERTITTAEDVQRVRGVQPSQIADWLAIAGDNSDGVPGVRGLGPTAAAALLRAYGDLESAIAAPLCDADALSREIAAMAKTIKKESDARTRERLTADRETRKAALALDRAHRALLDAAEVARFSRQLTALDFDAPLDVPWHDLPIGGYDVGALRRWYDERGFTNKAQQVAGVRKRAPWGVGR